MTGSDVVPYRASRAGCVLDAACLSAFGSSGLPLNNGRLIPFRWSEEYHEVGNQPAHRLTGYDTYFAVTVPDAFWCDALSSDDNQ